MKMMKKLLHFKTVLFALMLICACSATLTVKAQSTCATAVSFTPKDTFKEATYNITDSIYWLKFVATDTTIFLQIVKPANTPQANINHIYLNSGSCGRLVLLVTKGVNDSLMITYGPLTIGNTYYVKVNRSQTTSAYFGLGFQYINKHIFTPDCPPPPCYMVGNGNFESLDFPLYYFCPFSPRIVNNDTIDQVCRWSRVWGSPQIDPNTVSGNHYAKMWAVLSGGVKVGEAIRNRVNLPAGNYVLNFSYQIGAGLSYAALDSLIVCLTSWDNFNVATYNLPYPAWPINTRQLIYTNTAVAQSSNWTQVSIPFTTTSHFTNLVIYPAQSNIVQSWLLIDNVSIVAQLPAPIISGQWNTCHIIGGVVTTSDTIKNWNSAFTYHYYIGANGTHHLITTNPFNVDWTGHENGGMLYVEVKNDSTNCTAVDSFKVYACCNYTLQNHINYTDATISSDPSPTVNYIVINGLLVINGPVTFNNKIVFLGPNAKIVVNPNKRFRIYNSYLGAYCDTLWDGIYISPTAQFVDSTSEIHDAKSAIVSVGGGDFQVKSNSSLINNYKNIVVHYYNANHPGRISNTLISCTQKLLYPYNTRGTYIGIEADSVKKLFVGDSTITAQNHFNIPNFGSVEHVVYGIFGTDSYIYSYNNWFSNFGTNVSAYTTQVGLPYYGIYTQAININSSYPLSKLRVGFTAVAGYYKKNTFQNCEYGIQTTDSKFTSIYDNIFQYTAGGTTSYNNWGTAIFNYFVASSTATMSIIKNIFTTYAQAMLVWNNNYTRILCNQISLAANPGSDPLFRLRGICTVNCATADISSNPITGATGSNTDPNVEGLHVETGAGTIMGCNSAATIGRAIIFGGTCNPGTIIFKNAMSAYYDGFYLNAGVVGTQGAATNPNDNTWMATGTRNSDTYASNCLGGSSPFFVRNNPPPPSIYIPTINGYTPFYSQVTINQTPGSSNKTCTSCSLIVPANMIQGEQAADTASSELMDIAQGTSLTTLSDENKWLTKYFAYKDVLLNNIPTTGILSSFMQANQSSDIGLLTQVNSLIESGNYAQALITVGGIATTSAMAVNLKSFYTLYAGNLAAGRKYTLSLSQNATLVNMAQQCPYTYGPAVYHARAYLQACGDYTVYQNSCEVLPSATPNAKLANPNNTQQEVPISVYPNPANDNVTVVLGNVDNGKCNFELFDDIGNKIFSKEIAANQNSVIIPLDNVAKGVYICKIMNANNIKLYNSKLVIIK